MEKITFSLLLILLTLVFNGSGIAASALPMGDAIDKAGRQRMLTQRIVKSYCQMGQDVRYRVADKHLKGAIVLFEEQLAQLKAFNKEPETDRALQLVDRL